MSLTKEQCQNAYEIISKVYAIDDVPALAGTLITPLCEKEVNVFKQLIDEHFELVEEHKALETFYDLCFQKNMANEQKYFEFIKQAFEIYCFADKETLGKSAIPIHNAMKKFVKWVKENER